MVSGALQAEVGGRPGRLRGLPPCPAKPLPQPLKCHPCIPFPPSAFPVTAVSLHPAYLPACHLQLNLQPDTQAEFRVYVINLDLLQGQAYFVRIYAQNGAGLEAYRWGSRRVGGRGGAGLRACGCTGIIEVLEGGLWGLQQW